MKSLDKYVVLSIVVLLTYTVCEFVSQNVFQVSHDTLTTCVFAGFSVENFACALIKIRKIKGAKKISFGDDIVELDNTENDSINSNGEG